MRLWQREFAREVENMRGQMADADVFILRRKRNDFEREMVRSLMMTAMFGELLEQRDPGYMEYVEQVALEVGQDWSETDSIFSTDTPGDDPDSIFMRSDGVDDPLTASDGFDADNPLTTSDPLTTESNHAAREPIIQIFVKGGAIGQSIALDVEISDTIADIKSKIFAKEGFVIETQYLSYGTRRLRFFFAADSQAMDDLKTEIGVARDTLPHVLEYLFFREFGFGHKGGTNFSMFRKQARKVLREMTGHLGDDGDDSDAGEITMLAEKMSSAAI